MKEIEIYSGDFSGELALKYADSGIFCGFPSPAQDYIDRTLNFNEDIIKHPAATFYAKAMGDSMVEAGIEEGDILVIDRALEPVNGDIIVAHINQEFTVKYLDVSDRDKGIVRLLPGNSRYKPIIMKEGDELNIWGVVSSVIKRLR
ncbi:MAG: translesion error-prone DNA polymerase V autoproteolytic subunit [Muribaculaceae bacterium]|nr:translesion error-prone DNA polymerase V autoproteolytic subunit [Muribaculaceae bacterium]